MKIIDIYQLSSVVRGACCDYDDGSCDTPPELDDIIKHLDNVRQTLKKLVKFSKCEDFSGPNQSASLALINARDGAISQYRSELFSLEAGLKRKSRLKRVKRSSEPPQEINLMETLNNLERIRAPFDTALEELRYDDDLFAKEHNCPLIKIRVRFLQSSRATPHQEIVIYPVCPKLS